MKKKFDLYEEITNKIVSAMESADKWESGIHGLESGMPRNARGNYYSGVNILLLWMSASEHGFTSNKWMTYKQAKEKGGQVRKGEKGTMVIFYKTWEKENQETGLTEQIPVMRYYTVFNLDQIDGIEDNEKPSINVNEWDNIDIGDKLAESSECKIMTENCVPCYIPSMDIIKLPSKTQFDTPENYYTTLAHEMAHSTGHKSRLDRLNDKNKRGYAFEELVAELSAVFTCSTLGIEGKLENHASYIKSWLKAMQDDKKYIFKAATLASKATEYLLNNLEELQNKKLEEVA